MTKCENPCPYGKFDGCCHFCPDRASCADPCPEKLEECGAPIFEEETGHQAFQQSHLATQNAIASLTAHMKAALYDAMMKYGVKKFESDVLNLTLVEPTTATTLDGAKLKKKYPDIAVECSKTSSKAGYVKITLKDGVNNAKG